MTCPRFPNAPEPLGLRIGGDPRTCTRRLLTLAQSTVQTTLPEDDLFAGVVGDNIRGIPSV